MDRNLLWQEVGQSCKEGLLCPVLVVWKAVPQEQPDLVFLTCSWAQTGLSEGPHRSLKPVSESADVGAAQIQLAIQRSVLANIHLAVIGVGCRLGSEMVMRFHNEVCG